MEAQNQHEVICLKVLSGYDTKIITCFDKAY